MFYSRFLPVALFLLLFALIPLPAHAEGEAGIISLRGQGHFFVGIETTPPEENGSVQVHSQMYVGFQLVAEPRHPYPLVLVHGGGGQATDWFSTPDGRDGLRDYFLAAGFDVYWVDRPGFGRSPTNRRYGQLGDSTSTGIITFLAQSEQFAGDPSHHTDPVILNVLASSSPGPYGGDHLAAHNLSLLLERIGPAILVTYSSGAISGWWAADQTPDKVAGILAIEPASSNITSSLRKHLTFTPPLPDNFESREDADGCALQPVDSVSALPRLQNTPVHLVGGELGLIRGLPCSVKAFRQAGVKADYTYLPDKGVKGNGHLILGELNIGEVASTLIEILDNFK